MSNQEGIKTKPKKLPIPVKLTVGAMAGAFGTSCIFPIDMIKTRLQASNGVYKGPADCFRQIMANEGGIRGFYRGLGANLGGVCPEKAIKLACNEFFREYFEKDDGSIELKHEVLSAAGAGICQVVATNPMEIVKIRMQMQALLPEAERQGTMQVIKGLGLKGLYQGTAATLTRDVPFSVLFFPGYANLKAALADAKGENTMAHNLIAGIAAGALASGAVTPSDVIKTRLQIQGGKEKYKNMGTAFRMIVKDEGLGALYKGAIPRMIVVGPLFGITLLAFELQKSYMIKNGLL
jgi:solute carrier family 25 aspartate/glutamate transporter 12/13